jgi:hypothetical protein
MQRKPMKKFNPLPVHWVVADSVKVNGRFLTPGTELRIAGERGRFKFERYVNNGRTEWIDVRTPDGRFRAFDVARVRTVHSTKRLRGAA